MPVFMRLPETTNTLYVPSVRRSPRSVSVDQLTYAPVAHRDEYRLK